MSSDFFGVTFFWFHNVYKIGVSNRQIMIKHNVALRERLKMSAVHFELHPKNDRIIEEKVDE